MAGLYAEILIIVGFFAVPVATLVLFAVFFARYLQAVIRNQKIPNTYAPAVVTRRLVCMIVSGSIALTVWAAIIACIMIFFRAVAYM